MGPEAKLYQKLKKATPRIIWNRIENLSILGMPDLLGYNNSGHFFTVELKIARVNKLKFSVVHGSWSLRLVALSLRLVAWGLMLAACILIRLVLKHIPGLTFC